MVVKSHKGFLLGATCRKSDTEAQGTRSLDTYDQKQPNDPFLQAFRHGLDSPSARFNE